MGVAKRINQRQIRKIERSRKKFNYDNKRKSTHYLHGNDQYLAHTIDEGMIIRVSGKEACDINLFDLFDPNIDAIKGVYYFEWTNQIVNNFFFGRIMHHLRFLRTADWTKEPGDQSGYTAAEALEWICSEEFDEICSLSKIEVVLKSEDKNDEYELVTFGNLNANLIRCAIPRIFRNYDREAAGTCKKLLDGITRFANWYLEQPINNTKSLPAWCY